MIFLELQILYLSFSSPKISLESFRFFFEILERFSLPYAKSGIILMFNFGNSEN
jgi:hypothetical protein